MARKKRRRGAQGGQPRSEPAAAGAAPQAPEDEAAKAARREQQKREWAARKRKEEHGGRSNAPFIWGGGIAAVLVIVIVGGIFLVGGGGGDDNATPKPTPTEDPRIAGLPIDTTITIDMNDNGQNINPRYEPNMISANAGDVVEIIARNVGSVVHNMRIAGLNGEFEAGALRSDDWVTNPLSVQPGEEGRIVVKIDDPGSYAFKCDFHPTQTGTLVLN